MNDLKTSWKRAWDALGASGVGVEWMERLLAAYREPQRKYHTLQHLGECLEIFGNYGHLARHPGEVAIALWFHDAVYDVMAHDNEQQSAELAGEALTAAGVSTDAIERVKRLILATRHTAPPENHDEQLLVDVDLAILGAPQSRFLEYEAQVRAEYAWVPEPVFREKRREILEAFLARGQIYHTPELQRSLEEQARQNLMASVRLLGGNAL